MTASGTAYAEVIGDPIAHSKSPLIHGFWLDALGIAGEYRRCHVTPDALTGYFAERAADPDWRGRSVTAARFGAPQATRLREWCEHRAGVTLGMAMTEQQGGSDVRANTTRAEPIGEDGWYSLTGHKWFCSAPMCDGFLTLAYAPGGLTCFLLPRHRPDDTRNQFYIQRLKNKLGNCSNASSEVEFRGALAWMVGEEGRGVPTIIEMVAMTRFDCMVGSSALPASEYPRCPGNISG